MNERLIGMNILCVFKLQYHTYILSVVKYMEERQRSKQIINPDALVDVETHLLVLFNLTFHAFIHTFDMQNDDNATFHFPINQGRHYEPFLTHLPQVEREPSPTCIRPWRSQLFST